MQGWLAAGLDPQAELAKIESPPPRRLFRQAADAWLQSRVDITDSSKRSYGYAIGAFEDAFKSVAVDEITPEHVQAWIAGCGLSPASVSTYMGTLRQILDYAKVTPNPARERTVKLPRKPREQIVPSSATELEAILWRVTKRMRLPLVTAEQAAMRIGEVTGLTWEDVDEQGCRFRLRKTKGDRTRWCRCGRGSWR